jgi:CopG family nickel-responsive transcriptional regulator
MSELVRFSVSLKSALLEAFDRLIERKGYSTRSEAIRDLLRDQLVREQSSRGRGEQVAVVSLVYDHHARRLADRLMDRQHHHHELVVSTMHVHLGPHHCLEVTVLRGPARQIRHLGEELIATKGVLHGEVRFTGGEQDLARLHESIPR